MNSIIAWVGGKKLLRKEIISHFPEKIDMYVEVFGGAGWVLFGKDKHAKEEIYNDFNSDLVNLFRCLKHHKGELEKELKYVISAREDFLHYKELLELEGLTDIQRASLFFSIIRLSFGSKGKHFATRGRSIKTHTARFDEIAERLDKVVVENKDFEELIKAYDKEGTLFYLDPPYYGTESYYNNRKIYFTEKDHKRLLKVLEKVKGKWIVSYNDCPYIRELYKNYNIIEVTRKETLSTAGKNRGEYKELIIKNYT